MSREYFGYIVLHSLSGDDYGRMVRIGTIDIDYVHRQALSGGVYEDGCHIRTDDGFCSSSYTVRETPGEVLELIFKHDRAFGHFVRDFAQRNNFVLMKGELW